MKLLLIESATEICSVAIADQQQLISRASATAAHQHASHLTLLIESALTAANTNIQEITHLVLGHGPGSYTGLRVGAAVAKGICLARPSISFISVDSLEALARLARKSLPTTRDSIIYPTVNSRRGEVYTQPFTILPDHKIAASDQVRSEILAENPFPETSAQCQGIVVGTGANKVAMEVTTTDNLAIHPDCLLSAADLYPLAIEKIASEVKENFASYEPLYIKPPFVTKSTKKLL